jgi:hypothetical protein
MRRGEEGSMLTGEKAGLSKISSAFASLQPRKSFEKNRRK